MRSNYLATEVQRAREEIRDCAGLPSQVPNDLFDLVLWLDLGIAPEWLQKTHGRLLARAISELTNARDRLPFGDPGRDSIAAALARLKRVAAAISAGGEA
jgi:hypothetical protein